MDDISFDSHFKVKWQAFGLHFVLHIIAIDLSIAIEIIKIIYWTSFVVCISLYVSLGEGATGDGVTF